MNLHEARQLAKQRMQEHGLLDWSFRFDHAKRRFGSCQPTRKLITLSRALTLLNNLDQVHDTILHEIAHALTPGDNHGAKWKAMCRRIGAKPVRCYTHDEVVAPARREAAYQIGCTRCGWWRDRRRLTRAQLRCRACRGEVMYHHRASGKHFRIQQSATGRYSIRECTFTERSP